MCMELRAKGRDVGTCTSGASDVPNEALCNLTMQATTQSRLT